MKKSRVNPSHRLSQLGYRTAIVQDDNYISVLLLRKNRRTQFGRESSRIQLIKQYDGTWMMDSSAGLPYKLRNKGIGLYMYKRVIDRALMCGFSVRSDQDRSYEAEAVWGRLGNYYNLKYENYCWNVKGWRNYKLVWE